MAVRKLTANFDVIVAGGGLAHGHASARIYENNFRR